MTSFRSRCQVVSTELFPPVVIVPSAKSQFSSLGEKTIVTKNGNRRRTPCHCNSCCDSRKRHTVSLSSSKSTEEYLGGYYCCSLSKSMAKKKQNKTGEKAKMGVDSVKHTRYEMRLNVSLDMMFARLLFQDGAGNCKKKYYSPSKIF